MQKLRNCLPPINKTDFKMLLRNSGKANAQNRLQSNSILVPKVGNNGKGSTKIKLISIEKQNNTIKALDQVAALIAEKMNQVISLIIQKLMFQL